MSKDSVREFSDNPRAPDGAPDSFQLFLEERYSDWEQEFGDDIEAKRTNSFDPKR
ncbi:MAG: hypothetical protein ACRDU5_22770 [Mycobacterium sp.]